MLAGHYRASYKHRSRALLAALSLASSLAFADAPLPLAQRLTSIQEVSRFVPLRALPMLAKLEQESRAAPLAERAIFLDLSCKTHIKLGHLDLANRLCDELIQLGKQHADNATLARPAGQGLCAVCDERAGPVPPTGLAGREAGGG